MNKIITEKMKNQFLLVVKEFYSDMSTTTPFLEYDFPLATKWYSEKLPLLLKPGSSGGDFQTDVVKHLESDGMVNLNREKLTFRVTATGDQKIKNLSLPQEQPKQENHQSNHSPISVKNFMFLLLVTVVGGLILQWLSQ